MRGVAILGAAAMLLSGLIPWLQAGFGVEMTPYEAIGQAWEAWRENLPTDMAVLAASFALAAVALLLALVGRGRGVCLLAGLWPFGYLGWRLWRADETLGEVGLSLRDLAEIEQLWAAVRQVAAPGLYIYLFGAVALMLAGLVGFGRPRRR